MPNRVAINRDKNSSYPHRASVGSNLEKIETLFARKGLYQRELLDERAETLLSTQEAIRLKCTRSQLEA